MRPKCVSNERPDRRVTIPFGKIDYRRPGVRDNLVEAKVSWNGESFSVMAFVWNRVRTDCVTGGQCLDRINEFRDELDKPLLWDEVYDLWKHWHLNTLNAGTPEQMEALKDWERETGNKSWNCDYDGLCLYLQKRNLYLVPDPERPGELYEFGSRWLTWKVPDDVKKRMDRIMDGWKSFESEKRKEADDEDQRAGS